MRRTTEMRQMTLDYALAHQPRTRLHDWSTSIAAASGVRASAGRMLALKTLAGNPAGLTDFELADLTGWQQTSIGKRRGELFKAGLVEVAIDASGKPIKRPSPSGSLAIVWRITESGRAYLRAHNAH